MLKRINLNLAVLFSLIFYYAYILYSDTVPLHDLPAIPTWIITLLLLPVLTFIAYPILINSDDRPQDKIIRFVIILSILTGILSAMNYTIQVYVYAFLLILINLLFCYLTIKQESYLLKIYSLVILTATINLISLAFISDTTQILAYTLIAFEVLGFVGILLYTQKLNPTVNELGIALIASIAAAALGAFILTKSVPALILKIVIDQILGISLSSFDFFGFFIVSKNVFFMFHFAEFAFIGTITYFRRNNIKVWNIFLSGLDVSYPPILTLRIIAYTLYLNKEGRFVNKQLYPTSDNQADSKFNTQLPEV